MAAIDWSQYEVVESPESSFDINDYEAVPESERTAGSQVAALAPQVANEMGFEFPKKIEGLSQSESDTVNSLKAEIVLKETKKRAGESQAVSALRGVRDTAVGVLEAAREPENIALALGTIVAPQATLPLMAGLAAKSVGQSAGTLSVPGQTMQQVVPELINPILMTMGAVGNAKLASRMEAQAKAAAQAKTPPAIPAERLTTDAFEVVPESEIKAITDRKNEALKADPDLDFARQSAAEILKRAEEKPPVAEAVKEPEVIAEAEPSASIERAPGLVADTPLEAWADNLLRGGQTSLGPDVLAAYIVKGAAIIERGVTDFAKWSIEAIKELGDDAKPFLQDIFNASQRLHETRAKRVAAVPEPTLAPEATPIQKPSGLRVMRDKLVNSWRTRGNKADIARLKDAADNESRLFASQQGKSVALEAKNTFGPRAEEALRAVDAVIESGGDLEKLQKFVEQSQGKHQQAYEAALFAQRNWDALQPIAQKVKDIHEAQLFEEHGAGINTTVRDNYIKHAFDVDKLPNRGEEFFGSGGGTGAKSGFKAQRKFDTIYDAIEAGYGDAINTLDASKLVESRLSAGQRLVNDRAWVNSFRDVVDPTTQKPLISNIRFDANHYPHAPPGYEPINIMPGQFVAVHKGYGRIFKAVTGESKIPELELAGLPIGQAALKLAAGIKHKLLLLDTFHASRMMQKQFFLTGRVGWNKGKTLLEYADADLDAAVKAGEITKDMADYARQNRPVAQLLIKEGLNVGRIADALYADAIRGLPGFDRFTKWVFEKVTRGAMMESGLIEFNRLRKSNPKLTDSQIAAKVARDINTDFGNLGRQGVFKSRTFQDISRLIFLAPQWVESMARSEIFGFGQLAKIPRDLAVGKGLQVGTLGKAMAQGLFAYFIATQLLNLATRKQFTWQNREDEHKMDAWIPDVTGKTPGYFLSPMSVVAELTHDAYRFAFKKDTAFDIATQIAKNKLGPLSRGMAVLWSGKNFMGEKIDGAWNRAKEAAIAMAPLPIPLQATLHDTPGQTQRQLIGSAGLKVEPAKTPLQLIQSKATEFLKEHGKPKEIDIVYHQDAPHSLLRRALVNGDEEDISEAIQNLRKTATDQSIFRGQEQIVNRSFTGSNKLEYQFRNSLSPQDRELYREAQKQKREQWQRFLKAWQKRGPRPPQEKK